MHRRRFLRAAAITALVIPPLAPRALAARQSPPATPEAGGSIARLPARVAGVDPAALLDALRTAPVTTPLLPADTPPVEPVVWDDDSDTDLQGTLGGVIFTTGEDEHGNPALIGTAIAHPDAESAAGVIASMGDGAPRDFLGLPWLVHVESDFAASVVQIDYLLLVGGAEADTDDDFVIVDDDATPQVAASPAPGVDPGSLELRAISHLTALLDHLDGVLSSLGA